MSRPLRLGDPWDPFAEEGFYDPLRDADEPAAIPLPESLRLRLKILACPYRGHKVGCGCGDLRHCSAYGGRRDWAADYAECLECVRADRWPAPPNSHLPDP